MGHASACTQRYVAEPNRCLASCDHVLACALQAPFRCTGQLTQTQRCLHPQFRSNKSWWQRSKGAGKHMSLAGLALASGTGLVVHCMAADSQIITEKVSADCAATNCAVQYASVIQLWISCAQLVLVLCNPSHATLPHGCAGHRSDIPSGHKVLAW